MIYLLTLLSYKGTSGMARCIEMLLVLFTAMRMPCTLLGLSLGEAPPGSIGVTGIDPSEEEAALEEADPILEVEVDLEEADLVMIPWTGHLLTQEEVGLVGVLVEVMVLGGKMVLKVVEVQSGGTAMLVVTLVTM